MANIITTEEFIDAIVRLEQKRANIIKMKRKLDNALANVTEAEFGMVNDAEVSGFGDKIPELRTIARPRIHDIRKKAGIYSY